MNFAIFRTKKIKTGGSISAALQHVFRERPTSNANPEIHNHVLKGESSVSGVNLEIMRLTPEKYRKDAVRVIEVLVTATPDAFVKHGGRIEDNGQYFRDALAYLEAKFGKENVVSAVVHLDETTPHLSVFIVPLKDGKLNAKNWLGGRSKLGKMQTEFAVEVGKKYGLERGIEGSGARHESVKRFYGALGDPNSAPPKPPARPVRPKVSLWERLTGEGRAKMDQYDKAMQQFKFKIEQYNHSIENAFKRGSVYKVVNKLRGQLVESIRKANKATERAEAVKDSFQQKRVELADLVRIQDRKIADIEASNAELQKYSTELRDKYNALVESVNESTRRRGR